MMMLGAKAESGKGQLKTTSDQPCSGGDQHHYMAQHLSSLLNQDLVTHDWLILLPVKEGWEANNPYYKKHTASSQLASLNALLSLHLSLIFLLESSLPS